jgi:hypothetical protein
MKLEFESDDILNSIDELTNYILHLYQIACPNPDQFHSGRKLILTAFAELKKKEQEKSRADKCQNMELRK